MHGLHQAVVFGAAFAVVAGSLVVAQQELGGQILVDEVAADGVTVEPGYYYVLAEKAEGEAWNLVLVDYKVAHAKKLDA